MTKSGHVPFTKFRPGEPLTATTTRSSPSTEMIVYLPAREPWIRSVGLFANAVATD
jgi:hypothetical protein